jgi:chromate reductase
MADETAPKALRVLMICGSLRRESFNRKLMNAAIKLAPKHFVITESVSIGDIPLLNEDVARSAIPAPVKRFTDQIEAADIVIIATPEYGYGLPGVVKNAIDWVGCPQPMPNPLRFKPVALMGASVGNFGTVRSQLQLRQVMLFEEAYVLPKPEIYVARAQDRFDAAGNLTDQPTVDLLKSFWGSLERFVKIVAAST